MIGSTFELFILRHYLALMSIYQGNEVIVCEGGAGGGVGLGGGGGAAWGERGGGVWF